MPRHSWVGAAMLVSVVIASCMTLSGLMVPGRLSFYTATSEDTLNSPLGGPLIDKIRYEVIPGDEAQIEALLNDEVDLIGDTIDSSDLALLESAEDIETSHQLRNGYGYFTINCDKYPLNITALRRALAFAFDKMLVSNDVWDGFAVPQDSVVPQVNPFSIEGQLSYSYYDDDIDTANSLLDGAGFLDVDSDGYREAPNGSDFAIQIETADSSSIVMETGGVMEQSLQAIGINGTNAPTDFYDYLTRLYNHEDYDMVFLGSSFTTFDVDWMAYEFWSEYADKQYWNFPNFRNETYDSYRDTLLYSTDYDEVFQAAQAMQTVLAYECPIIVAYENFYLNAYRTDRFEGHVNDAVEGVPGFWTNLRVHLKESQGGPYGGIFRISNPLDVDTFNPFVTPHSETVNSALWPGLMRRDADGKILPWLADSYSIENHEDNPTVRNDTTRFTFSIVRNATWSDGTPLTAHDIAFTYNFYREAQGIPYGVTLEEMHAAYALTDYTLVVEFMTESYWHISSLTIPIMPRHFFVDMPVEEWNRWNPDPRSDPMITSGPFNVTDYVPGGYMELSANPYYFRNTRFSGPSHEAETTYYPPPKTESLLSDVQEWTSPNIQWSELAWSSVTSSYDAGVSLTWTANDQNTPETLESGDIATGDHVRVNATYVAAPAQNITLTFGKQLGISYTKDLVVPSPGYDPLNGTIHSAQFSWAVITGIQDDDTVDLTVNFTNTDCAVMAWWNNTPPEYRAFSNNLLGGKMVTDQKPESHSFVADCWDECSDLLIACFNNDSSTGSWTLDADIGVLSNTTDESNSVQYDTYQFGENTTCDVRVSGQADNGTEFQRLYDSITFNNFFAPEVEIETPIQGEEITDAYTVAWRASSRNVDHEMQHEVLISTDGGKTFQLYASNLKEQNITWYPGRWKFSNETLLMVRTQDRGMSDEDVVDEIRGGNMSLMDVRGPVIFAALNQHLTLNTSVPTGDSVRWMLLDLNPGSLQYSIDDSAYEELAWHTQRQAFSIPAEAIGVGKHSLHIVVIDQYGNTVELDLSVDVRLDDTTVPSVDQPADIRFTCGATGNEITWTVEDDFPGEYAIVRNGSLVDSGQWESGTISINVDGLDPATYNYTLTVTDLGGNSVSSTVWVVVSPSLAQSLLMNPFALVVTLVSLAVISFYGARLLQARRRDALIHD